MLWTSILELRGRPEVSSSNGSSIVLDFEIFRLLFSKVGGGAGHDWIQKEFG